MDDSVQLPGDLAERAMRAASDRGMTLPEFVCNTLERVLSSPGGADSLFADDAVFVDAGPVDEAENHDAYLYRDAS